MARGLYPKYHQFDDKLAITTSGKCGSTSLAKFCKGNPVYDDIEASGRGLTLLLILREPWARLSSAYWSAGGDMTVEQFIDRVLSSFNIHWSPQTELHRYYDETIQLERIHERFLEFPHLNIGGLPFKIDYRRDEIEALYAEDFELWQLSH